MDQKAGEGHDLNKGHDVARHTLFVFSCHAHVYQATKNDGPQKLPLAHPWSCLLTGLWSAAGLWPRELSWHIHYPTPNA